MVTNRITVLLIMLLVLGGCNAASDSVELTVAVKLRGATPSPTVPATATVAVPTEMPGIMVSSVAVPATEEVLTVTPSSTSPGETKQLPQVDQAVADLARLPNVSTEEIEVVEVEHVTWPDASLGCPQPGMAYTQVPRDGLLIRLRAADQTYEYHSGGTRAPFLCEQTMRTEKTTPISVEDLITPSSPNQDE